MAEDVAAAQGRTSNPCCAALEKRHLKLLGKYSKLEEIRNEFRKCTALVQEKYDVVEKENGSLKKELEELKVQADIWKAQKEKEYGCCVDLDDEVSALKEEIQMLKQKHVKSSQDMDKSEKEIKDLKKLLDEERERAAVEKKNAGLNEEKSAEALRETEEEKKKVLEAKKVANVERKNAEENRLLLEKLKSENESLKDMLASERSKVEAAEKKGEDDVSALKEEIQMLKHRHEKASQDQDKEIQERLIVSEKQIKHLKELLDIEWKGAAMEKNNYGSEEKKYVEALKEVEEGKKKASEAEKVANVERKKAEESRLSWEKIKTENDELKAMLTSEVSKTEALDKKVEAEKQKAITESKRADLAEAKSKVKFMLAEMNLKKAMLEKDRADVLNQKLEEARIHAEKLELNGHSLKSMLALEISKTEAAEKKVKEEMVKAIAERKRADLVEAESKEKFELVEKNLEKAMLEKDRADDLNRKLEEARIKTENLDELNKLLCSEKLEDAQLSKRMLKILLEKEDVVSQEKKRAHSAKMKAKKQKKVAEEQKKLAKEHKHKSGQLFNELQSYKLILKELPKDLQELVSQRIYADNASLRYNGAITESVTVKLPKKRLILEKILVKHDSETAKVEALRKRELFHLKQEPSLFQQRLKENSSRELVPLPKRRRKTAHEGVINIHCFQDYGMPKSIIISGNDRPGDDVMIFGGNGGQKAILGHIVEWFNTRVGTLEKENTKLRADMVAMETYHRGRYDLLQQRYDGMHTSVNTLGYVVEEN